MTRARLGSVAAPALGVHGRCGIASLHRAIVGDSRGLLNGLPGAIAGVLRHRLGDGQRRPWDGSPQGMSDAVNAGQPAHPLGPRLARPRQGLVGGRAPSDPRAGRSVGVSEPGPGERLVEPGRKARGSGAKAREGVASTEAQVCVRSYGPASRSAVRTRELEISPNGAPVLPEAGRGQAQEGLGGAS